MRDRGVAARYAKALLISAVKNDCLGGVVASYAAVSAALAENAGVRSFLEGPQVSEKEKKKLLDEAFGDRVEPTLLSFFRLLIDKNRIEYLQEIAAEFARQAEKAQGFARAEVVTAVPLAADLEEALGAKLKTLTGCEMILDKKVEPAVIGGVKVTIGDRVIDGTLRTDLKRLRRSLSQADVR